jgi:hypothetical protein
MMVDILLSEINVAKGGLILAGLWIIDRVCLHEVQGFQVPSPGWQKSQVRRSVDRISLYL